MVTGAAKGQAKLLHRKSHKDSAEDGEDRISNLPDTIVHRIFGFLPFEDAAKTCVLSKRWKHIWYSYPCLDFSSVFRKYVRGFTHRTDGIDHVLRLLEKHSDVKILRFRGPVGAAFDLVGLMEKSVEHSVQELDVEFWSRDSFSCAVPHCIANSLSLRDLRLKSRFDYSQIALPPLEVMKNGFKSLQSLSLLWVNLSDEPLLQNLFTGSSFPSLTNLRLESCSGLKFLRIQMPGLREFALKGSQRMQELDVSAEKLKKLSVGGCFHGCRVSTRVKIDAPSLEHLIWSRNAATDECDIGKLDSLKEAVVGLYIGGGEDFQKMRSASSFLTAISHCPCLTLESELIRILSRFKDSAGFQLPVFERLRSLKVVARLDTENATGLASLFRSSPFVDTIFISIEKDSRWCHEHGHDFWGSQARSLDSFLGHLRFVKVLGSGDETNDRGLVRFLLKHVRGLRRFSVSNVGRSVMADIVKSQVVFE